MAFARERSEWEKVADRPDEGTFFQMFDYLFLPVVGPVVVLACWMENCETPVTGFAFSCLGFFFSRLLFC
jgi:hypothetical protein